MRKLPPVPAPSKKPKDPTPTTVEVPAPYPLQQIVADARRLEAHLRAKVLGQGAAAKALAEAYVRRHLVQHRQAPTILTFLGPPGVGKTLAARTLAEPDRVQERRWRPALSGRHIGAPECHVFGRRRFRLAASSL